MSEKKETPDTPPPVPDEKAAGKAQAISRTTRCIETLPKVVTENYEVHEWRHACAILKSDFPAEYKDIVDVELKKMNGRVVADRGQREVRMSKITIIIRGGTFQGAISDTPGNQIRVMDFDDLADAGGTPSPASAKYQDIPVNMADSKEDICE